MKHQHITSYPHRVQRYGRWMGLLFVLGGLLTGCASIKPVTSVSCTGPTSLIPSEDGTFSVSINEDATRPLDVQWDFGDGSTDTGLVATHAFTRSGTYNVTVTAANQKSTNSAVCPVEVLEPPTCQVTPQPATLSMCTQPLAPVRFRASVTGSTPISYTWNFGDGGSSSQSEPSHTYTRTDAEPATLTRMTTLSVSNAAGEGRCSAPINIEPCPCNPDLIFGQACFDRGERMLPEGQARRNLQDNLEVLRSNPRTIVVVLAFAQRNERDAETLAGERARAIAQFYIDNGVEADRITSMGMVARDRVKIGPVCAQTIPFCDEAARDAYIEAQQQ